MLLIRNLLLAVILLLGALPSVAQETAPEEVTVGVYVNDIQQLDLQTHSYAMDFYVWLRWKTRTSTPRRRLST